MVKSPVLRGDARVPCQPARVGVRACNRVRIRERRRTACTRGWVERSERTARGDGWHAPPARARPLRDRGDLRDPGWRRWCATGIATGKY